MDDYQKKYQYLEATQNEIREFLDDIKKIDERKDRKLREKIISNYEKLDQYFQVGRCIIDQQNGRFWRKSSTH